MLAHQNGANLSCPIEQHRTDMANRLCWIQPLGTDIDAVLDAMASEHTKWIIESREPVIGRTITAVCKEPVGLQ